MIESLPQRTLLSVALVANELRITGTDGDDRISVGATPFINALVVDDNNVRQYYALAAVKTIIVKAGAGDDRVNVDPALNSLNYDCAIYGGAGNDTLTGSGGKVHVDGEDGNDRIRVYAATSGALLGGNGRDCLYGSDNADTAVGGGGNDKIFGFGGKDVILSGLGNDTVDAGNGNDTVTDSGGRDSLRGGAGNDAIKGLGAATVLGDEGDDTVVGTNVSGGDGNDVCYGSASGDLIHGDAGNDLLRGGAGKDALFGDDGDDALFGGSDNDELHGGGGNDNLYGSDGYTDTNHDDDGHDAGFGEGGADWWEGPHVWRAVDWRENSDRLGQNKLSQDTSVGHYKAGEGVRVLTSSGNITVANGSTLRTSVTGMAGSLDLNGVVNSSDYTLIDAGKIGIGNFVSSTILNESLNQVGWLSSGAWDAAQQKFVPLGLNADQRRNMRHVIAQLPKGWKVGEMIPGGNDVVYYRVSQDGVTVQSESGLVTYPGAITLDPNAVIAKYTYVGDVNLDGAVDLNDYQLVTSSNPIVVNSGTMVTVPTPGGGTAQVASTTPGLYDGVKNGRYRFLAVKRGTVIISNTGTETDVKQWDWTSQMLALPVDGDVRIAGDAAVHTLAKSFAHVPSDVPAGARGILVNDGAVWLPGDGSSATFAAG